MTTTHEASLRPGRKPIKDWVRSAQDEAAFQKMQATCRKHAELKVEVMEDVGPLQVSVNVAAGAASAENTPVPQLVWNRTGTHQMTSGCQSYQVTKQTIEQLMTQKGKATSTHAWRYRCWVRVEWLWYIHHEGLQLTYEAAQEVCEAHRRQQLEKAAG